VTSVNDAPNGTDSSVTTLEDTTYTFSTADFGFTDPSDVPNALSNVKITTVPLAGSLTLSGVAVTAGQFVSAANIRAGALIFTPVANASGTPYAAFFFQVQDDGGTANGGVDLDTLARTMTVNVNPNPPIIPLVPVGPAEVIPANVVSGVSSIRVVPPADSATGLTAAAPSTTAAVGATVTGLPEIATLLDAGLQVNTPVTTTRASGAIIVRSKESSPAPLTTPTAEIIRVLDLRPATASELTPLLTQSLPAGLRIGTALRGSNAQGPTETPEEAKPTVLTVENGVRLTGVVVSAGVVTWALQGAGILASILTSAPAWRHLDPMPVLAPDEEKPAWRDDADSEEKREEDAASALWRTDTTPDGRGTAS
jgi:hypothetical protein